MIPLNL